MVTDAVIFIVEDKIVEGCMLALTDALLLLPFLLFDFVVSCFDEVVGGLSSWKS